MDKIDRKQAVYIIDGSSFLYRAYYSIRPLTTKNGIAVNAVYGFCRMIKKLLEDHDPSHLVLVWDSPGKTVRHDIFSSYKETRQAAPNDLFEQKKLIKKFADIIGLVELESPGIEADDLMYSLAKELELSGKDSVLVTSDKDLLQALSDKIVIFDPFKDIFKTRETTEEKYGFSIERMPFYFALIGDSSDNIPGAKGIGPKTAQLLVSEFISLDDLYNNLDKVKSERVRKLLEDSKASAYLSLDLFKLRMFTTYLTYECCAFTILDWQLRARPLFEELEFKTFLKEISDKEFARDISKLSKQVEKVSELTTRYKFVVVNNIELLNYVIEQIKEHKRFGLDTETTGIDPLEDKLVGLSICCVEGESFYIPFGHVTGEAQLKKDFVLDQLRPYFEDKSIEKYLHNAKFDMLALGASGVEVNNVTFDTMLAASLIINEGQRLGLKYLSDFYLEEPMVNFADVLKKGGYKNFSQVPIGVATEYAAADAHQTLRLKNKLEGMLGERNLLDLFNKLEMPLMHVLFKMERKGILVNKAVLSEINVAVSQELSGLNRQILDSIGEEFKDINLNSSKQLEDLLFNNLHLPVMKKTNKRTAYSTDQEVLRKLAELHPVPGLILKYRESFKIKSTYLEGLPKYISKFDGKIHTSFNQAIVTTGRLSSSDPNLQNIPVDKYYIRSAFQARQDFEFVSADYSQIELRVLAFLSQDKTLLEAFSQDKDIHILTAAGLFGVAPDQVTHDQRQVGKRINFSILYGLTPHGLSKSLNITHNLAKTYIDKYMEQYPGVSVWMNKLIEQAQETGYVETYWGRRRYIPGIRERNKHLFELACRLVVNTAGQGTAAELVKLGMIKLDQALVNKALAKDFNAHILLQIHDELLFEVQKPHAKELEAFVKDILENIVDWNVPLKVTTRIGSNWQDVTK